MTFSTGGNLTLTLTGLAFAVGALRLDRPWLLLPGAAVLSYALWCRPEAPIHLLPALVPAVLAMRRWGRRFEIWAVIGWVGLAVAGLLFSFMHRPDSLTPVRTLVGFFTIPMEGVALAGPAIFPWWLLVGFPVGAALAPRPVRVSFMILLGLLSGWIPVFLGGMPEDLLEGLRYGTPALAWLALVSGAGLHWLVGRLPEGRLRAAGLALMVSAVAGTPLLHLDYLATSYGPRSSDIAFRKALREVPAGCGLVVPGEDRDDGLDPSVRYRYIIEEELEQDPTLLPIHRVVSAPVFLAALRQEQGLPGIDAFAMDPGPRDEGTCWFVFLTGECLVTQSMDVEAGRFTDPGTCQALEAAVDLEPVETFAVGFRYHRLVTVPRVRSLPRAAPDFRTQLLRIRGRVGGGGGPDEP